MSQFSRSTSAHKHNVRRKTRNRAIIINYYFILRNAIIRNGFTRSNQFRITPTIFSPLFVVDHNVKLYKYTRIDAVYEPAPNTMTLLVDQNRLHTALFKNRVYFISFFVNMRNIPVFFAYRTSFHNSLRHEYTCMHRIIEFRNCSSV